MFVEIDADRLTEQEEKIIQKFRQLEKLFNGSGCWVYAASGKLYLMRRDKNGRTAVTESGGTDPNFVIAYTQGIHADGGDW